MQATRVLLAGCALVAAGVAGAIAAQEVPGAKRSPTTVVLENAAELLQRETPIANLSIYLVGFHPMKDDAQHQMEAHHYCNQLNEEVAQCVLFEGGEANSRLKRDRQDLAARARPQCGVDALSGTFASGAPIAGVSNRSDGCPEQPSESASAPH